MNIGPIEQLRVAGIAVAAGREEPSPSDIESMAKNLIEVGQLHPIGVDMDYQLIWGLRRLRATEQNGCEEIEGRRCQCSQDETALAELSENLMRRDYSALDRAKLAARYAELCDSNPGRPKNAEKTGSKTTANLAVGSKAAQVAEKTGTSKRTAERDIAIGEAIPDDVAKTLKGTPTADNQAELARLAKLTATQQRKAAERIKSGKAKTVTEAADVQPKSGKQKSDPRAFSRLETQLGAILRGIDNLHRDHPHGNLHNRAIRETKQVMTTLTEWNQASHK